MKDATRRRNAKIVDVWNMGVNTLAELGQAFGMPRNSVGRILTESRRDGVNVLSVDLVDRCARMSRGQLRRLARAGTFVVQPAGPGPTPPTADGGQASKAAPTPTF